MLVLTRRPGESVCIGDGIVVTVIAAARGKVRLGVEAPKSVLVVRDEVRDTVGAAHPHAVSEARNEARSAP